MGSLKDAFLDRLIIREGGYANHPDDPGGQTMWGVSEAHFPALWRDGPPTQNAAREVLWKTFYLDPGLDKLDDEHLREQIFDFGVNAGPSTAIAVLQVVVDAVPDGKLGPKTLAKVSTYPPGHLYGIDIPPMVSLNLAYETARAAYYARITKKNPSNASFLSGWLSRAASLRTV